MMAASNSWQQYYFLNEPVGGWLSVSRVPRLSQLMRAAYYGCGALSYKWSRELIFPLSHLYIGFPHSFFLLELRKYKISSICITTLLILSILNAIAVYCI